MQEIWSSSGDLIEKGEKWKIKFELSWDWLKPFFFFLNCTNSNLKKKNNTLKISIFGVYNKHTETIEYVKNVAYNLRKIQTLREN